MRPPGEIPAGFSWGIDMRYYISDVIGNGEPGNWFRPAVDYYIKDWAQTDGRTDFTATGQAMLVECQPDDATHALMIADGRIEHLADT